VTEQRKASEILLELEAKLDKLLGLFQTQNLNYQILSNKLNEVMTALKQTNPAKISVEAVNTKPQITTAPLEKFQPIDPERQVPIFATNKLPETNVSEGFRRTSRPETFTEVDSASLAPKFPVQIPKAPPGRGPGSEVATAPLPPKPMAPTAPPLPTPTAPKPPSSQNAVPVQQRVVDKNGKSLFLADVEVSDLTNGAEVYKTRTNGTGKWMASLPVGTYRVVIRKRESLSKDKASLEAIQDIQIDGTKVPLDLATLIIK
jgi:hypothetical protein